MKTNEELVSAIQAGDSDLMDLLWNQCYGFICQQAFRWSRAFQSRTDFDADDLIQSGYIALYEAVKTFELGKGTFVSFLAFYLKTEFSKVAGCRTSKRDPLDSAISLETPAYSDEDSETTIGDNIPVVDPGFEEVEEAIFNQQMAAVLDQAMEQLPEKQRKAIKMHYLHRKTYGQIAEDFHCSAANIEQTVKRGLRSMKIGIYAFALIEMLYGDRNYYKRTGYLAWKETGCSSPEWELLKKEDTIQRRRIWYLVKHLGMTEERARRLCPV